MSHPPDTIIPRNPAYLAAFFAVVEALLYGADAGLSASDTLRRVHRAGYLHGYNLAAFGPEVRDVAHIFAGIVADLEGLNLEKGASGGIQNATPEPPADSP